MAPDTRVSTGTFGIPRNTFGSKWDTLFDKDAKEWMAFKPALGLHVYPCYSCRHMFYSKKSFLDHVNRRAIVLQYKCSGCSNESLTFYNRCSFLLHCRKHYDLDKGTINLSNLEVSIIPLGLAGFSRHPDVPYLFNVEEELIEGNSFMNSQFYAPKTEDKGKEVISLRPSHLMINRADQNGESLELSLKQIAKNIPKCQFIGLQALEELRAQMQALDRGAVVPQSVVKNEPEECQSDQTTVSEEPLTMPPTPPDQQTLNSPVDNSLSRSTAPAQGAAPSDIPTAMDVEDLTLPVITKIETVDEPLGNRKELLSGVDSSSPPSPPPPPPNNPLHKCSECQAQFHEPLSNHFLGANRPLTEKFRCVTCRLICPTLCSFQAHARVHGKLSPYVCPDCGFVYPELRQLIMHMDEVCFHMAKSVRFRCPGRRCGKIFASEATFGPHFRQVHIETLYMCGTCKEVFTQLVNCEDHCLTHTEDSGNIVKVYACSTCGDDGMNFHKAKKHVDFHCSDLSRCIYIFMCKFCKCYFRSVQTMATHLQNCKVQKTGIPRRIRSANHPNFVHSKYISGQCVDCKNKIICLKSKPSLYCSKCLHANSTKPTKPPLIVKKPPVPVSDKCVCILCKVQIDFDERRRHQQECKYAKPQVLVERLDLEKTMDLLNQNQSFSSSNSDLDGSHDGSPQKNRGYSSDENRPRKRPRPSRPKKSEMENDLTAEEPIAFDGTYQCRLCDYKNTERVTFHEHIKVHRHISTAYQCMECGECFVVKPSLQKHLRHYHNIADSERYFLENDCFDRGAVTELAKVVKAPYLANNVKENQCKVCLEQFEDSEGHDKHFRTHGMAFLMKNSM